MILWSYVVGFLLLSWFGLWPLALYGLVPAGWVRATFEATRASPLGLGIKDRAGGAAFMAAWAHLYQTHPNEEDETWLLDKIREQRPLTGAGLAALGLLAQSRGDHEEARAFLGALSWFNAGALDPMVRQWANDFLVANAAQRGDWEEVERLTEGPPTGAPRSAASRLLGGMAKRLLRRSHAPSPSALIALRASLPTRHWPPEEVFEPCLALYASDAGALPEHADESPTVASALLAQQRLVQAPSATTFLRAVDRWEEVLPALDRPLAQRVVELRASLVQAPSAVLRDQVAEQLSSIAEQHDLPFYDLGEGPLAANVRHRVREGLLAAIEVAGKSLGHRLAAGRCLTTVNEAREWLALARLYQRAVAMGGEDVRRVSFRTVYDPLCALSVDLHNNRREVWLSNGITRWLLEEATTAQDRAAIDLQTRNLRV